jgi:2-C-methyl-D-erythritol 4-phosphate cytidylyltransferase
VIVLYRVNRMEERKMKNCAIIVAAGKGTRMNADVNKQFMDLCGIPVLARSLIVFSACRDIDRVILVANEADIPLCGEIIERFKIQKVTDIVAGGDTRPESVYNGIRAAGKGCGYVAVHDGARPLVTVNQIEECLNAAKRFDAACLAVQVVDTIKTSEDALFFDGNLNREILWRIQTPQIFRSDLLAKAYEHARKDGITATDDTTLVERIGVKVRIVVGSVTNIKITTMDDLRVAQAIARAI